MYVYIRGLSLTAVNTSLKTTGARGTAAANDDKATRDSRLQSIV